MHQLHGKVGDSMSEFGLGRMTFGSLFKKPETLLYPLETKPAPEGLKGHIVIKVDDCILCGICERTCPCSAIKVSKPDRTWEINRFQCVQCGSCVRACPKKCLSMDPSYTSPSAQIYTDSFSIPEKEKPAKAEPNSLASETTLFAHQSPCQTAGRFPHEFIDESRRSR